MRIEFNYITFEYFAIGLFAAEGEDDYGQFKMLTIGFLLFSIDLFIYS